MADVDTEELLTFACRLADAAGEAILPLFRQGIAVNNKRKKRGFDPVTEADRAAEVAMRALIAEHYPGHTVRGEELPVHDGTSPLTWYLDPIDGTKAFIYGVPVWATLVGLADGERPLLGVMNQPFVGERFVGSPAGAFIVNRNGSRQLETRKTASLETALMATTDPINFEPGPQQERFAALADRVCHTRYGGDAYFYCLLAAGLCDLVVDPGMDPYDIVALIPIVEQAGGIVTTWDGGPAAEGGNIVAAATSALHEAAVAILSG